VFENANTSIVAVWDGDVLVSTDQLEKSVKLLRDKLADFVFPYTDRFLDTSNIVKELYIRTRDLNSLKSNENKMTELYAPDPVGGGFFANRKAYTESGLENLSFYGWGRQDGERVNRWEILGYKVKRVKGPIYHFTHRRGINSKFHSKKQSRIKRHELERLAMMSKNELENEISGWRE
jgi:predicted glycosyltransferase involved in capsule biosynthesis